MIRITKIHRYPVDTAGWESGIMVYWDDNTAVMIERKAKLAIMLAEEIEQLIEEKEASIAEAYYGGGEE